MGQISFRPDRGSGLNKKAGPKVRISAIDVLVFEVQKAAI